MHIERAQEGVPREELEVPPAVDERHAPEALVLDVDDAMDPDPAVADLPGPADRAPIDIDTVQLVSREGPSGSRGQTSRTRANSVATPPRRGNAEQARCSATSRTWSKREPRSTERAGEVVAYQHRRRVARRAGPTELFSPARVAQHIREAQPPGFRAGSDFGLRADLAMGGRCGTSSRRITARLFGGAAERNNLGSSWGRRHAQRSAPSSASTQDARPLAIANTQAHGREGAVLLLLERRQVAGSAMQVLRGHTAPSQRGRRQRRVR